MAEEETGNTEEGTGRGVASFSARPRVVGVRWAATLMFFQLFASNVRVSRRKGDELGRRIAWGSFSSWLRALLSVGAEDLSRVQPSLLAASAASGALLAAEKHLLRAVLGRPVLGARDRSVLREDWRLRVALRSGIHPSQAVFAPPPSRVAGRQ